MNETRYVPYVPRYSRSKQIREHLTTGANQAFRDSKSSSMKCSRTKCTAVIRYVLAPHFHENLKTAIGDMPYSIIIDETTDIQWNKVLGIAVRFVDVKLQKVSSTFLGIMEIKDGTAETVTNAIDELLRKRNLNPQNCVGIGTDNASVMTGEKSGVHVRLEKLWKRKLFLSRCVCHSIQLAVSAASTQMSPRLEFMVKETANYFRLSTGRRHAYTDLYKLMEGMTPLKLKKVATTRWLSIYPAMELIASQYDVLKMYFYQEQKDSADTYTATLLSECYQDLVLKSELFFLCYVLKSVWLVEIAFQSNNNAFSLLNDLKKLILDLARIVLNPTARVDVFKVKNLMSYVNPKPYCGHGCESILNQINDQIKATTIRLNCVKFVIKLIDELKDRLPSNLHLLENISELSVNQCLRINRNNFLSIELLDLLDVKNSIDVLQFQWLTLPNVQWYEVDNSIKFWFEVYNYENSSRVNSYRELAMFVFTILALPLSNAEIERIFSSLSIVKSKLRNRLLISTVDAILTIKYGLFYADKCCFSYASELPDTVLRKIGQAEKYVSDIDRLDNNCIITLHGLDEDEDVDEDGL